MALHTACGPLPVDHGLKIAHDLATLGRGPVGVDLAAAQQVAPPGVANQIHRTVLANLTVLQIGGDHRDGQARLSRSLGVDRLQSLAEPGRDPGRVNSGRRGGHVDDVIQEVAGKDVPLRLNDLARFDRFQSQPSTARLRRGLEHERGRGAGRLGPGRPRAGLLRHVGGANPNNSGPRSPPPAPPRPRRW